MFTKKLTIEEAEKKAAEIIRSAKAEVAFRQRESDRKYTEWRARQIVKTARSEAKTILKPTL